MTDLSPDRRAAIRARHPEGRYHSAMGCNGPDGCDALVALAALDRAEAERDAAKVACATVQLELAAELFAHETVLTGRDSLRAALRHVWPLRFYVLHATAVTGGHAQHLGCSECKRARALLDAGGTEGT